MCSTCSTGKGMCCPCFSGWKAGVPAPRLWNCSWVAILVDMEGVSPGGGGLGMDAVGGEKTEKNCHGTLVAWTPQGCQRSVQHTRPSIRPWGPGPTPCQEPMPGFLNPQECRTPWGIPGPLKADPHLPGTLGGSCVWEALAITPKKKKLQKVNMSKPTVSHRTESSKTELTII